MAKYVFTITAGRTGTAWLTELISKNTNYVSVHEPLGIDDFGTQMPDIRTMRTFNDRGMTPFVTDFWQRKFDELGRYDAYAETNHTLAKCGLLEYLSSNVFADDVNIICLRRNWVKQCISYINRADFANITLNWQWYLDRRYARKIMNPAPFTQLHNFFGSILWYMAEMEARQEYYKMLYSKHFNFIDCSLEGITQQEGAEKLIKELGGDNASISLPPKINANQAPENNDLVNFVQDLVSRMTFNTHDIAKEYIESGQSLA